MYNSYELSLLSSVFVILVDFTVSLFIVSFFSLIFPVLLIVINLLLYISFKEEMKFFPSCFFSLFICSLLVLKLLSIVFSGLFFSLFISFSLFIFSSSLCEELKTFSLFFSSSFLAIDNFINSFLFSSFTFDAICSIFIFLNISFKFNFFGKFFSFIL